MKKTILLLIAFVSLVAVARDKERVSSPDGSLVLTAGVSGGQAFYQLQRSGEPVINLSNLGFQLAPVTARTRRGSSPGARHAWCATTTTSCA